MISGLDDLQKLGKDNLDIAMKSASALNKGFQALATEAADYSRHSIETGAKAFEKLVAASSLDKAVEVQSDYLRTAYQGYVSQATKVGEIVTAMACDAYKPYESYLGKMTR